jgi:hypothetical protein
MAYSPQSHRAPTNTTPTASVAKRQRQLDDFLEAAIARLNDMPEQVERDRVTERPKPWWRRLIRPHR